MKSKAFWPKDNYLRVAIVILVWAIAIPFAIIYWWANVLKIAVGAILVACLWFLKRDINYGEQFRKSLSENFFDLHLGIGKLFKVKPIRKI